MPANIDSLSPRIHITGETAGTGATTVARVLAEKLRLPRISGGKYFRALAAQFDAYLRENSETGKSQPELYDEFLQQFLTVYQTKGFDGVLELLKQALKTGADGAVLANFHSAIAHHQETNRGSTILWDQIVDAGTLHESSDLAGYIWESKLAVVLHSVDQFRQLTAEPEHAALSLPILRVLLTVDLTSAAHRVAQRENRQVHTDEILQRQDADFARYGDIYTANTVPLKLEHLKETADLTIDTTELSPEEVVTQILGYYLTMISSWASENLSLSQPIVRLLLTALDEVSQSEIVGSSQPATR
jgi:cytidylate kinase